MSNYENPYQAYGQALPAANADVDSRAEFIRKTYTNLGVAVLAFACGCGVWFATGVAEWLFNIVFAYSRWGFLAFMVAFSLVATGLDRWAHRTVSLREQYTALGLYVVLESLFFAPMLYWIAHFSSSEIIMQGAGITLFIFFGLTAIVFFTAKDFSFLRGTLLIASWAAVAVILAGAIFGFSLGIFFVGVMVALACGYILYYTSAVMRDYPTTHHAAAALSLFAALALLFWYVLQLLSYLQRD